jgi:hypothetical protein
MDSGGDIKHIGTTLADMHPGPAVEFFIDVLNDIASKYPSDVIKMLKRLCHSNQNGGFVPRRRTN